MRDLGLQGFCRLILCGPGFVNVVHQAKRSCSTRVGTFERR